MKVIVTVYTILLNCQDAGQKIVQKLLDCQQSSQGNCLKFTS
ncbi:hypothetical protein H1P_220018 [Hyella patelloides LEGE 07179]|uniref:Uncharacterized protein n=1 Tax=Hyella patelloides LEGE 07179 TaxID=945734 RepID=A0A563VR84_9CYAN|nr:hypothetical protein H1P_220018 [Hyella patelloides LEGE 07179]